MLKFNGKVMKFGNVWGCATPPEPPDKLIIDLNGTGNERTADFLSQSYYPGVWDGYRIFETNSVSAANTTYHNLVKNLQALDSNFTMYYWFAMTYAGWYGTNYCWGEASYTADSSMLVSRQAGWTSAGQDSQNPWFDKSRYRTVEVNVSKGGDVDWTYWFKSDPWYGSRIYYAIPEQLITKVINPAA